MKLKDAYLGGLKEEEREENSGETDNSESEPRYYRPAPQNNEACGKPLPGGSAEFVSSKFQKSQSNNGATMEHFLAISPHHVPYMNDVYDMVRKVYARPADDPMKDLNVNMAFGRIFMNVTPRAAIHLGKGHDVKLRNVQNSSWITAGQLFGDTEKLISGLATTTGTNMIDSQDLRWISTSVLHSRAHQYATAKVCVFSDSVLCLGRMGDDPNQSWKNKIKWYSKTNFFSELNRIDGKPMELEWKILPGFKTAAILKEIQKNMGELQSDQDHLHVNVQGH